MSGANATGLDPRQARVVDLIAFMAVNLVDHPDAVTIDVTESEGREVYQLHVHPEDLGQIIGKGGQTARALRMVLQAVGARSDQRISLEIAE